MNEFFDYLEKKDNKQQQATPELDDLEQIWHASRAEVSEPPLLEQSWAAIQKRIRQDSEQTLAPVVPMSAAWQHRTNWRPLLAIAAILILSSVGLLMTRNQAFDTDRGISNTVQLEDASSVALNADSRLTLIRGFNKKHRNVQLQGEAFFKVEKGSSPFIIQAGKARIRVVGTEFNVFARGEEVRLDVLEGEVEFWSDQQGEAGKVRVKAGQSSTIQKGEKPQAPQASSEKDTQPAWLNKEILCDNLPFSKLCEELERRFDVQITVAEALKKEPINGRIDTQELKNALDSAQHLIGHMTKGHWRFADGHYIFE